MHALEEQIEQTKAKVEAKLVAREELNAKFVSFQVCLSVLLDDNYLRLLIEGDFIIQAFLQDYKSRPVGIDGEEGRNYVDYIEDLVKHNKDLPADLPSTTAALSDALYNKEYFDKEETSVEKVIDDYIGGHVQQDANIALSAADYRILLGFLDAL